MVINLNRHGVNTITGGGNTIPSIPEFSGSIILSDTDESGSNEVRNIVVLSESAYALLTPNSKTLYFIT